MSYASGAFFLFFATTFALYYLVPGGHQQVLVLVAASLFFYAWESPQLLGVFLISWLITGISSHLVLTALLPSRRRLFATVGVIANLGLLGLFKYKFLAIHYLPELAHQAPHSVSEWLILAPLPIGISFYTFHGISLLVDVFRGNQAIQAYSGDRPGGWVRHFSGTLLYLSFFPQLIAGPIIKAKDFFPQVGIKRLRDIDYAGCFRTLVLGFFLKSVVADNLSEQTFWIAFPYFRWRPSIDLLLMLYGYSAQIFADFAGYSLIAIGLAGLLGYRLPENFNFPYFSTSIADFWRRWHISLSSWLRDYLYVPLGGSRKGVPRTYVNLIIVMLLGGLWHGAALSFAVWGLWHGVGLALERPWLQSRIMTDPRPGANVLRAFIVFNFVTLGWLFFKLQDFSQAMAYLRTLLHSDATGFSRGMAFFVLAYSFPVFAYHLASVYRTRLPLGLKDAAYGVMLFFIITNQGPATPFIYFQF
jgi:alginate O-acetyltransferase complex protein AlgI